MNGKRIVTGLMSIVLTVSIVPGFACAANRVELEEQIEQHRMTQDIAHRMADCARQLGFEEDHFIILAAREKWWEAYNAEQSATAELEELDRQAQEDTFVWNGSVLTRSKGINWGPTGKETYYNLPMQGVVSIMRRMGYDEVNYPYWVRNDGVKMLGDCVMVAANLSHFPRGSIVPCSLGKAIVCDTGGFAHRRDGWNWLDIATSW